MSLITIKDKYQIVIPKRVRAKMRVRVGDLLEAHVERGKITLTPKSLVDRGIDESLEDFRQGRSYGPFTHKESIAFLRATARKAKKQRRG